MSLGEEHAFDLQEAMLPREAAAETAEAPLRAGDTVAGDEDGNGIRTAGGTDGAAAVG